MCDVEAGRIDRIVVYKIDRLTRSLTDFATGLGAPDGLAIDLDVVLELVPVNHPEIATNAIRHRPITGCRCLKT